MELDFCECVEMDVNSVLLIEEWKWLMGMVFKYGDVLVDKLGVLMFWNMILEW